MAQHYAIWLLPWASVMLGMPLGACSYSDYYAQNPHIPVIDATASRRTGHHSADAQPSGPVIAQPGTVRTAQAQGTPPRAVVLPPAQPAAAPPLLASTAPHPPPRTQSRPPQSGVVRPYVPDDVLGNDLREANLSAVRLGPEHYQVVMGDTLYAIAFRYGLDYRALARRNNIEPPYHIRVGQILNLDLKGNRAPVYVVKKGDTLYSIAREQGQPLSFLAAVNNLSEPYTLRVGQRLNLARRQITPHNPLPEQVIVAGKSQTKAPETAARAPKKSAAQQPASQTATQQTAAASTAQTAAAAPKTRSQASPAAATAQQRTSGPASTGSAQSGSDAAPTRVFSSATRQVGGITWSWPANGKVIAGFSLSEQGNRGLDIAAARGARILAAADGEVVYAGDALRGYGNLVIVNHAHEYLSAYAHNEELLVKEGQKVKRGQQLATMGSTDAQSVRLHFEIRYRGQSVNPTGYLPKTSRKK